MAKILVVDDEQDLCDILQFNLQNQGYEVATANSAEEALARPDLATFDLILLDVMMEGMSGFQMARQMKQSGTLAAIPIIFCTAKDTENDTLTGFSLGADDYIAKPFRLSEVAARVKAVLHRTAEASAATAPHDEGNQPLSDQDAVHALTYEHLIVDLDDMRATIDGRDLLLTRREFDLLVMLLRQPGRVHSREEILSKVWPDDVYVLERSVDVNVARLRKKLGDEYGRCLVSRSGYGYAFKA